MNVDGNQIIPDERVRLLDELESVLKKQLELAHQGDSASEKFEALTSRASCLVQKMASLGIRDSDELKSRRSRLHRLYGDLCLVVAAEKADAGEDMARIRRGRKIIGTYRQSM
jgi:hypothetical protein